MYQELMQEVQKVDDAQTEVYRAQRNLQDAKHRLGAVITNTLSFHDAIESGIVSINLGVIRRRAAAERGNRRIKA